MKRVVARRLRWAGVTVVGLVALAATALNVYLNSSYLPRLIRAEQQWLHVEYRLAWSLWPGIVHFEGVKLRGDERGYAWMLEADRATLDAEVIALAERQLVIEELRMHRPAFRLRPRVHYLDADEDSPLAVEGPELPPEARAAQDPWAVTIRRAKLTGLRELWIDRLRIEGPIDTEGAMEIAPGRQIRVGPARWSISGGALSFDGSPVLEGLEGSGDADLGPFDLVAARGAAPFATLSSDARIEARLVGLKFLAGFEGVPLPLEVREGAGPFTAKLRVKDGRLTSGTELAWQPGRIRARVGDFESAGTFELAATVSADAPELVSLTSTMRDWTLGREGQPPQSSGRTATIEMQVPVIEMSQWAEIPRAIAAGFGERPGKALLEDVRLFHLEPGLQLESRTERLEAQVDLGALRRRELVLTGARATGSELRAQERPKGAADADPPPAGWALRATDAVFEEVRDFWLGSYRFRGDATTTGDFAYEKGGRFSTGLVRVDVHSGELEIGPWKAGANLAGSLEVQVRPLDVRAAREYGFYRTLDLKADLEARVPDVSFLRHWPSLPYPAELRGGEGPLTARLELAGGVVSPGSQVRWESKSIESVTHGHRIVGPVKLEATWSRAKKTRMQMVARLAPYRITRVGQDRALVKGSAVLLTMEAPALDLARPSFKPFTTVHTVDGVVPDLRAVNAYLPADLPFKVDEGAGNFNGSLSWTGRRSISAAFEIGGKRASISYDGIRIRGDWRCEAKLANVDVQTGKADIVSAQLQLDEMAVRQGSRASERWFGTFEMKGGKLRPGKATLLEGDVETRMRDGRPLISFLASRTELLPKWAESLVTLQALRATARLRIGEDWVELDRLNAHGQSLDIRGRLRKQGDAQRGDLLVTARGKDVGVAVRGQQVELKLIDAAAWYQGNLAAR